VGTTGVQAGQKFYLQNFNHTLLLLLRNGQIITCKFQIDWFLL